MWLIRYDDGGFLDSSQCDPHAIPFDRRFGVLWILQGPEHDRLFNKDNYIWRSDRRCWLECDDSGLKYHLARSAHDVTCYLQGSVVPRGDWHQSMLEMDEKARSWPPRIPT